MKKARTRRAIKLPLKGRSLFGEERAPNKLGQSEDFYTLFGSIILSTLWVSPFVTISRWAHERNPLWLIRINQDYFLIPSSN